MVYFKIVSVKNNRAIVDGSWEVSIVDLPEGSGRMFGQKCSGRGEEAAEGVCTGCVAEVEDVVDGRLDGGWIIIAECAH